MANFGVTGGIGAGIMQGLQFMRQREGDARQEQALANQTERLNMQKQIHGEKMGQINRANAEVQRAETLDTLKGSIEANYQDRPDYERAEMFRKYGAEMGMFKPADLDVAVKVRDGLVQVAGPDAYRALIAGNISPMQRVLATKGYDIKADTKGGNYLVRMPGSDSHVTMSIQGIGQINEMATWRDQENAKAKTALDRRKTEAEIQEKIANANLKDRLPQERVAGSGAGSGKGGKDPKAYDPIGTLEDFNKAIGNDPQTSQPYAWAPTALQHYQQIIDANPSLAGTKQGGQYALNLAMALGRGDAKAVPEIDANGNTKLIATWPGAGGQSPRKAVLQDNIDMSDPSLVLGVGGNQIVKPEEWMKVQGNALQSYARSRPDEYRLAAAASADDSAFAALEARARTNPDAARAFNFAKITRELSRQQTSGKAPARAESPADDAAYKSAAAAAGIDPDDSPATRFWSENITKPASRMLDGAKGAWKQDSAKTFEARLARAVREPSNVELRRVLLSSAKGDSARLARIQESLGAKPN